MARDPQTVSATDVERRGANRFTTDRPARFTDASGTSPLRPARVLDMSPSGIRLSATIPPAHGDRIEIEIESDRGGDPMMMRGEVIHLTPKGGKFSIGVATQIEIKETVRIVSTPPPRNIPTRPAAPRTRPKPAATVRRPRRGQRRTLAAAVVAALLALLLVTGAPNEDRANAASGPGWSYRPEHRVADREAPTIVVNRGERARDTARPGRVSAQHVESVVVQPAGVDTVTLDPVATDPVATASADFVAIVPDPTDLAELSVPASAARAVHADGYEPGLHRARSAARAFPHRPTGEAPSTGEPLLIEVDTTKFVLHVRRHGAIVRTFPIGLGRDATTPVGRFVIADKIVNPDWFDRGRVVPAHSPENPLGAHWMGLAQNELRNGIGIHPTTDAGSLAQPASRGCIRMTPADAASLFRLAPAGTPVWIHE